MTTLAAVPKRVYRWSALCLGLALAACASGPPTPEWQIDAHGASQKAQDAYLAGDTRVEQLEWNRARSTCTSSQASKGLRQPCADAVATAIDRVAGVA